MRKSIQPKLTRYLYPQHVDPLALAIENAIQLSSSGLTLAELRAQFASEAASGDGTIESALEQLIGSGIVYELGGRYCAL